MDKVLSKAKYVVSKANEYGSVTPMKLQKLLYYMKVWGLVAGYDLVEADFEKWDHGPINRDVYQHFKSYGRSAIPKEDTLPPFRGEKKAVADFIITCYAQYDALTLSSMAHKEDPWREADPNQVISETAMVGYYENQQFSLNFPFDPENGPFYPVDSDTDRGFTLDMNDSDAESVRVYDSYNKFVEQMSQASSEYQSKWKDKFIA